MSASEISIDLMALADIAQPRKLAFEIHRQLREKLGSIPLRCPLAAIASAVGIVAIEDHATDSFEGTLLIKNDQGAIVLRKGMPHGRRNFTLGHELGHFLNPWHRTLKTHFECTKPDVNAARGKGFSDRPPLERIEVEANEFSAALLVPAPEFRTERQRLGRGYDVAHIRELATAFDVSVEFMARIYIDTADEKLAVVLSRNGTVSRIIPHKDFPFLGLRKGAAIPRGSATFASARANPNGWVSPLGEMAPSVWLDKTGHVTALYEQVMLQRDGWAVTLLGIDEDLPDDEEDDRNWNRRNTRFT